MKKKGNRFLTLMVMTVIVMLALTACGGYQIETGSVSGGAVSGQAVSGSAVSDSTALNIHVMKEGKVTIPNPADVEGSADVYLRKSPDATFTTKKIIYYNRRIRILWQIYLFSVLTSLCLSVPMP